VGNEVQSNIPIYGKRREQLNTVADLLEKHFGTPEQPTAQVRVG